VRAAAAGALEQREEQREKGRENRRVLARRAT